MQYTASETWVGGIINRDFRICASEYADSITFVQGGTDFNLPYPLSLEPVTAFYETRPQIDGAGGNDVIRGSVGGGGVILFGGDGNDTLYGGSGYDWLYGEGGDDTLRGGGLDDWLYGGAGSDILWGEAGIDTADGGDGIDFFYTVEHTSN